MKTRAPKPEHVAFMDDLKATLGRHTHLSGVEMLAVASQFVGNLIAAQDQRRYKPDQVMEMVARNIETGNQEAVSALMRTEGKA